MSHEFRELLKKVGSGTHTSKDLTRQEAATATLIMLQQEATPAQIGAFMIAHRIKRPTPEELAGMLDAYDRLGGKLTVTHLRDRLPVIFGNPYDGRSRTVPVMPITTLILASVGIPVILHGGDRLPTKYGIPLSEIWRNLGVNFFDLALNQAQASLEKIGIAFLYLPRHFPEANALIPYRDQIGKRPPFATAELIWLPAIGDCRLVAGFVHPPTEDRFRETFKLRGINNYTTVKGLEGSCDLSVSRTGIIGLGQGEEGFERLHLHPRDYNLDGTDLPLESTSQLIEQLKAVIAGQNCELMPAAILNGGFYLWRFGICETLSQGFARAEMMLTQGQVAEKLQEAQRQTTSEMLLRS